MHTLWYDPTLYGWMPGTLFGVGLGLLGSYIGVQASRRSLRRNTLRIVLAMMVVSAVFLCSGIAAFVLHQPYGVWYGLLLPGAVGLLVLGANLPVISKRLREQSSATS